MIVFTKFWLLRGLTNTGPEFSPFGPDTLILAASGLFRYFSSIHIHFFIP